MRLLFSVILHALAVVIGLAVGVIGFILCCSVIAREWGFGGVVLGIALAPVTFLAAPIYAGIAYGNWSLLILEYGGSFVAFILYTIAGLLAKA